MLSSSATSWSGRTRPATGPGFLNRWKILIWRPWTDAIFYVLSTGCQWNAVPTDLPPKSTIYDYLDLWDWEGTLEHIHNTLYLAVREQALLRARPTATAPNAAPSASLPNLRRLTIARFISTSLLLEPDRDAPCIRPARSYDPPEVEFKVRGGQKLRFWLSITKAAWLPSASQRAMYPSPRRQGAPPNVRTVCECPARR
jgi:transposase